MKISLENFWYQIKIPDIHLVKKIYFCIISYGKISGIQIYYFCPIPYYTLFVNCWSSKNSKTNFQLKLFLGIQGFFFYMVDGMYNSNYNWYRWIICKFHCYICSLRRRIIFKVQSITNMFGNY